MSLKETVKKILHQGRLVTIYVNGYREDKTAPTGRVFYQEQIVCYDTTVDDVRRAIMDSLLSKGFVSADELRQDWKDKIQQ